MPEFDGIAYFSLAPANVFATSSSHHVSKRWMPCPLLSICSAAWYVASSNSAQCRYLIIRQERLESTREAESDLFLVQMVRLQRVIETIHTTDSPSAPARLYVKAYQADIERLRKADRCPEENIFLHMQYLIAELHIAELALAGLAEQKGASLSGRLEDLHRCVEALKALCKLATER